MHAAAKLWETRRIDVTMVHRPLDPCPASGVHCIFVGIYTRIIMLSDLTMCTTHILSHGSGAVLRYFLALGAPLLLPSLLD